MVEAKTKVNNEVDNSCLTLGAINFERRKRGRRCWKAGEPLLLTSTNIIKRWKRWQHTLKHSKTNTCVKGKGGGETINLEKQFVKGLQNLGKSVMLVMDGTYNFILINIRNFMRIFFSSDWISFILPSDLTSDGNPVTRGLSVRYDAFDAFGFDIREAFRTNLRSKLGFCLNRLDPPLPERWDSQKGKKSNVYFAF